MSARFSEQPQIFEGWTLLSVMKTTQSVANIPVHLCLENRDGKIDADELMRFFTIMGDTAQRVSRLVCAISTSAKPTVWNRSNA